MPLLPYRPAWWLPGPHAQTLWGKFGRRIRPAPTRIERIETPDGDFLEIHRLAAPEGGRHAAKTGAHIPRVILLHGLEGTIHSHYAQGLLAEMHARGWAADLMLFRSCGTELNRARRFYHSGETTDLRLVIEHVLRETPSAPLALVGVSLGGNVLLKYLGESHQTIPPQIAAAAAVSVPFDLGRGSRHISQGFSRVYERHFIRSLKHKVRGKQTRFPDLIAPGALDQISTLYDFDNHLTAPIHGFTDADHYYRESSSIRYLNKISINTLLFNAWDDPFLPRDVLSQVQQIAEKNPYLHTEFPEAGGHAGFVSGRNPWRPLYYLEHRVGEFLAQRFV
jgi:predicted alpha/beta-fold hydrolase